jgi:Fur family transcriptional regulator, stress-responsive regulator
VHDLASDLLPELSLATVYNTLKELVAMGEVNEVAYGGAKRYDPNVTGHHQHLVCVRCGELRDVQPQGEDALRLSGQQRHGYQVLDVDIVFRGVCERCQAEGVAVPASIPAE